MDTRALLQNWDAAYQSQAPQWAHSANVLMQNADTTAATGGSGQVIAGAPIMLPPGMAFGRGPITSGQTYAGTFQFGGAFANGGIAPPGKVSLVGERGAELIVPSGPTAVIPLGKRVATDNNPVNGRPATFDGMPRTQFFASNSGKTAGTVPVYNDIRTVFNGGTPRPDPRSFGTGGQNFTGPMPMPGTKPTLDATTGKPVPDPRPAPGSAPTAPRQGMLVASSSGGYKWQPGTGPGTSAPPQSSPPAAPAAGTLPFGQRMPTLPGKAAPFNDTGSAMDRHMSTGLAGSARRPVGRSANDPQRIAEQMRRRGDPSAILRFGAQQMGQDFARERDAVNFAQNQMMFGQQQQAMDARDARNFDQGLMMFGMQQGAMDARDERNFQQQQQIEAQRRAAEQAAAEEARKYGLKPVPVSGTGTPYFQDSQGRIYAGSQPDKAPDPMPPGLVPVGYQNGRAVYGQPDDPKRNFVFKDLPGEIVQDKLTGAWRQMPGQTVRVFEDGTYEPIQPRGQANAPAAQGGATPAAQPAQPRRTTGGFRVLMGQLPNENHSSPLTAEQSLRAAQQSYQKSGYQDDSALRAHFAQFPGANATAYAQQQAANQAQQNAQRAQAAQEAALADAAFRARQNRQGLLPAMASGAAKGFAEIGSDLATLPSVANQMSVDYMRRMIGNMNDAGNAAVTAGKTAYDLSLLPAKTVKAVTDAAKPVLLGSDQKTQAELDWEEFQRWKKNNKK